MKKVTLDDIKKNQEAEDFLKKANDYLATLSYTEHGIRHAQLVADIAKNVLERLDYKRREMELASIAGYLHDIGNVVGRVNHEQIGAIIAKDILEKLGMTSKEIAQIILAIGNHEEETGEAVDPISAALILADKTDVHRSRVHARSREHFDIHDQVNYAVTKSFLRVDEKKKTITLELTIETKVSKIMSYFEIFLSRMMMCRKAAKVLGCKFELNINGTRLL